MAACFRPCIVAACFRPCIVAACFRPCIVAACFRPCIVADVNNCIYEPLTLIPHVHVFNRMLERAD